MAEMVGSAVVQEVVSGAFSFMRNNHEEMASKSHLIERLKYVHLDLKFALERTKRMPMIEVSLLQRRMMLKHVLNECRDLLYKHAVEDEGAEQGVPVSHSLPNRIMHLVKPFFGTEKGSIRESCVKRFELFAEKSDKFVRDVESGCSLALYRFSSPLITQLTEGKILHYKMVSGSHTRELAIYPCCLEDYGVVANLLFEFKDFKTPMKCFTLILTLRLSESTDIVGISTKCLKSLEPEFKSVADVASGELAQISTQVCVFRLEPTQLQSLLDLTAKTIRIFRPRPLCCIGDGFQPSAKNILPSELTERFSEQVCHVWFERFISADDYNVEGSTVETNRNTIKAWPILQLSVEIRPHFMQNAEDDKVGSYLVISGVGCGPSDCSDLSEMAKFLPVQAVDCFKLEPERTEYEMLWCSGHGLARFIVSKPTTEMGCVPQIGDGSKTRRASKRRR